MRVGDGLSLLGIGPNEITERPHAPSGVAALMPAHIKTPHITPSMEFSSGKEVVRGGRGQQLEFALGAAVAQHRAVVLERLAVDHNGWIKFWPCCCCVLPCPDAYYRVSREVGHACPPAVST